MTNIFLDNKVSTKPIFKVNYTLISGIEHSLGSKDLRFDLGSAMYYLNFINYEKKNAFTRNNSEYFDKLNALSSELENFLSFYGSDDLLTKYSSFRNGLAFGRENYSDTELGLSFSNLNLIKHFYDGALPNCSNKFYVLKNIEENLVNSENKKDLLLASFCYKKYCDDDFFRAFDDVELSVDDVFNFISECEGSNLKITNRQITNLLGSFKTYYLTKNDLVEDYENEKRCILEAYDRYCTRNWAFEKDDFINFFNSLYNKKFKTFGFSNDASLLTSEILDEVIGDNKFTGYEKIKETGIGSLYFSGRPLTDREQYCHNTEHRREIFKQYYDFVSEYCSDPHVTIHYFIYSIGASAEDEKIVEELIDWCYANSDFNSDLYSEELKENTDIEIRKNFKNDLLFNYKERINIFNRHLSILDRDGITKYGTHTMVRKVANDTRKEQISKLTDVVVNRAKMSIDNGLTGWDIFDDINLSQNDILFILNKNGVDWHRLDENNNAWKNSSLSQLLKNAAQAVTEYVTSDISIGDVCNKYGCLPGSMSKYVEKCKEREPEIFEKFHCKATENNDCIDNSYIDIDYIVGRITNGIVMPNGENRKYTYFDLVMDVGHNVNLGEIKNLFDKDYPNNYFVATLLHHSIQTSSNLRELHPYPREIRSETITININGKQHTVTDEERETVLGFLEKRDLPSCLYYDAVRAYLNEEFDPNKKIPNKRMVKTVDKTNLNGKANSALED